MVKVYVEDKIKVKVEGKAQVQNKVKSKVKINLYLPINYLCINGSPLSIIAVFIFLFLIPI
jgi:hypothetical protein